MVDMVISPAITLIAQVDGDSALIPLAATVLGGVIALVAAGVSNRHSRKLADRQIEHAERLAEADRWHRRREDAYTEVLRLEWSAMRRGHRLRIRAHHVLVEGPSNLVEDRPHLFSDDAWDLMSARLSMFGSKPARDTFRDLMGHLSKAENLYETMLRPEPRPDASPDEVRTAAAELVIEHVDAAERLGDQLIQHIRREIGASLDTSPESEP